MRMYALFTALAVLAVSVPLAASAEGLYVGAGYSQLRYDDEDPDTEVETEPGAVMVRLGVAIPAAVWPRGGVIRRLPFPDAFPAAGGMP